MDQKNSALEQRVKEQYERFPFPDYGLQSTPVPMIANSDDLSRISARLFEGRLDPSTMNVLVAGGGTGEKTLGLALQLAPVGGRVTHLDLSSHSVDQARRGMDAAGIDNVRFVQGSIYDVGTLFPDERFDYIQCMGVLHHLPDPAAGLAALRDVLTDEGGISLAVYATTGRTAIYLLKDAFDVLMDPDASLDEQLSLGAKAFEALPASHWLNFDAPLMRHLKRHGPKALLDAALHSVDHHYSIDSFMALIDGAGLSFVDFSEPYGKMVLDYVDHYGLAPEVTARLRALPITERRKFLELFNGRLVVHSAYLTRSPRRKPTITGELGFIPSQTIFGSILTRPADKSGTKNRFNISDARYGGIQTRISPIGIEFLRRVDGVASTEQILTEIASSVAGGGVPISDLAKRVSDACSVLFDLDIFAFTDRSFAESKTRLMDALRASRQS